ncbi:hypothetical protein G6F46_008006 [Rhizopus delemar]|uniref:Transmembrane protein n=3 Tax=Rhizopus TaxID=4842 RepID=I1CKF9_RHIO9|nr:hypothetical protein RO3G_13650 [Rhizopus delemar RA 99-880]KAG1455242.1 hypothetical protein G6F55_007186 [Rhizopus delemar]KAG1540792.1 hypothetical protein G6F51_008305 [Rhizopus arrhizus]KAG1495043.1 hypothetical protein G6F54_007454 [Rhizopus delemar]KAG1509004.1 hypothetical protein G6F53_007769 [Rhizopus delemar]|eukprot:EIE88939.1 hypothetical protein RO3G_13650 [Rhizopus delemar RA 99-880]
MHSVLVIFGLLSVFMLVSSLPLGPSILEKRQLPPLDFNDFFNGLPIIGPTIAPPPPPPPPPPNGVVV